MDLPALLVRARGHAGLSQAGLAARAGVARASVNAYEQGHRSPTVQQLDRLLGACGLRLRPELEPRTADEDAVLDAAAQGEPLDEMALQDLLRMEASLADAGVRWAADRHTALTLHGLHVPQDAPALALQDGLEARVWLGVNSVRAMCPTRIDVPWPDRTAEQVAEALRFVTISRYGFRWFRLDPALPEPLLVQAHGRAVPVLPLHELERQHADIAVLLRRRRARQADG